MLKKISLILFAGSFLLGADYLGGKKFEKTQNIEGVSVNITVFQSSLSYEALRRVTDSAFELVQARMGELTGPEGWQIKIGRARPGESLEADDFFAGVLKQSLLVANLSDASLDITDGPLRDLWEAAKENAKVPEKSALDAALDQVNNKELEFDPLTKKISVTRTGVQIDLKDEVMAAAVDRAAEFLTAQGVEAAIIDAGTVLRTVGKDPVVERWRLGLEHPRVLEEYMGTIDVEGNKSVSTYGDYDDFFIAEGKRYPLHIDCKTGFPPLHKVASVSVVGKNSLTAVLLAKALFVLGPEKGYELIDHLKEEGVEAIAIEEQSPNKFTLSGTEGAQSYLKDIRL